MVKGLLAKPRRGIGIHCSDCEEVRGLKVSEIKAIGSVGHLPSVHLCTVLWRFVVDVMPCCVTASCNQQSAEIGKTALFSRIMKSAKMSANTGIVNVPHGISKPSLKILLAEPRGFCAGVDRAIKIVELALEKFGAPVYVRHEIVHNRFVVDSLRSKGAVFVEELDEVPDTATAMGNTALQSACYVLIVGIPTSERTVVSPTERANSPSVN